MILYEKRKKRKPKKPDAKARQLAADWEKLKAANSAPLVKGAKANGVKLKAAPKAMPVLVVMPVEASPHPVKNLPAPISDRMPGTKAVVDELAGAKAALKHRLGQSYNKGTIQYLTDDEIKEQRSGSHKRR